LKELDIRAMHAAIPVALIHRRNGLAQADTARRPKRRFLHRRNGQIIARPPLPQQAALEPAATYA